MKLKMVNPSENKNIKFNEMYTSSYLHHWHTRTLVYFLSWIFHVVAMVLTRIKIHRNLPKYEAWEDNQVLASSL